MTFGLPFARGALRDLTTLSLVDGSGQDVPLQHEALAHWSDGSIRWVLLDCVARTVVPGTSTWELKSEGSGGVSQAVGSISSDGQRFVVAGEGVDFQVGRANDAPILQVIKNGRPVLDPPLQITLTDARGRVHAPNMFRCACERCGPVRTTLYWEGLITGCAPSRLKLRLCFFRGTGLVRLRVTLLNPRRARHRGGLWDLGDPGSIHFADVSVSLGLGRNDRGLVRFVEEMDRPFRTVEQQDFEIYQDSSGGENWRSPNHVNRFGRVPCSMRGYRLRTAQGHESGLRATPVVRVASEDISVTATMTEFWQQFPKAIDFPEGVLRLRLFPAQAADLHELQGGEQKTHEVWLKFGAADASEKVLDWVHRPAEIRADPGWYARADVFAAMLPAAKATGGQLDAYLAPVLEGAENLFARREVIDEFGWRNYGDLHADHENAYFTGQKPVISHYNNQFDFLNGAILQYVRTGDTRWMRIADPLARHVIDIDIYHTEHDRAAYCNGLFWMTDHYLDAGTSTHRTYSRKNRRAGVAYGGGPGSSHNFTNGLLKYHYLTGDPQARQAVIGLAEWVIKMDDGRCNWLGVFDDGPTGLASFTTSFDYHGPGRGSGLSINSQLDAWLLTHHRRYLNKAEELVRRCVHPVDDIDSLDLLNAELRWSYSVFLVALARYLRCKIEADELDEAYAYGRASLLHYAEWMLANERPFLDQRDRLEYPTETWPAQDFRKANAMRMAAEHADEPMRGRLLEKASELSDKAWQDLTTFESSHTVRAIAIVLTEGASDHYFRASAGRRLPLSSNSVQDFGLPIRFVSQKVRVKHMLRRPWTLLYRLAKVPGWLKNRKRFQHGELN